MPIPTKRSVSFRLSHEEYRTLRKLRERTERPSDTIRRILRAGIAVLKTPENSPVKETAQ